MRRIEAIALLLLKYDYDGQRREHPGELGLGIARRVDGFLPGLTPVTNDEIDNQSIDDNKPNRRDVKKSAKRRRQHRAES